MIQLDFKTWHEVPFGMDISQFEPVTPISYEEEGGNTLKKLKPEESVVLKEEGKKCNNQID